MEYLLICSEFDLHFDELRHNEVFNIFLSFSDEVPCLTLKNNLRITLGSKPEKF